MKKSDIIFARKEFLNLPGQESVANIVSSITLNSYGSNDDLYRSISTQLVITDCSRIVDFNIDIDGDEYDRENALHKVNTFIGVLTDFRDALEKECAIQKDLYDKRKEKEILDKEQELKTKEKDAE